MQREVEDSIPTYLFYYLFIPPLKREGEKPFGIEYFLPGQLDVKSSRQVSATT